MASVCSFVAQSFPLETAISSVSSFSYWKSSETLEENEDLWLFLGVTCLSLIPIVAKKQHPWSPALIIPLRTLISTDRYNYLQSNYWLFIQLNYNCGKCVITWLNITSLVLKNNFLGMEIPCCQYSLGSLCEWSVLWFLRQCNSVVKLTVLVFLF